MVLVWFQLRAHENLGKSMDVAAFARKTIENHWFVQSFCYQNRRISWVFAGFATKTLEIQWFSLVFLGWRSQTIVKP